MDVLDSPAFRIYAAVSAALILKMVLLAFATVGVRSAKKIFVNAEDAKLFSGENAADHEAVARIKRAHLNAIENEVPFVVLGLLYALMGADPFGMQVYAYTFFTVRVLHSLCYVFKLQPFRSLFFVVGALCLVGMSVQVLMRAFA